MPSVRRMKCGPLSRRWSRRLLGVVTGASWEEAGAIGPVAGTAPARAPLHLGLLGIGRFRRLTFLSRIQTHHDLASVRQDESLQQADIGTISRRRGIHGELAAFNDIGLRPNAKALQARRRGAFERPFGSIAGGEVPIGMRVDIFDFVECAPTSFRLVCFDSKRACVDKSGRYPALIPVPVPAADNPAGLPSVGEWKPRSCSRM